jgi:hypothetical protein
MVMVRTLYVWFVNTIIKIYVKSNIMNREVTSFRNVSLLNEVAMFTIHHSSISITVHS